MVKVVFEADKALFDKDVEDLKKESKKESDEATLLFTNNITNLATIAKTEIATINKNRTEIDLLIAERDKKIRDLEFFQKTTEFQVNKGIHQVISNLEVEINQLENKIVLRKAEIEDVSTEIVEAAVAHDQLKKDVEATKQEIVKQKTNMQRLNEGIALARAGLDIYRVLTITTGKELIQPQIVAAIGIGLGIIQYAMLLYTAGMVSGNIAMAVAAAQIMSSSLSVIQQFESLRASETQRLNADRDTRQLNRIGSGSF